MKKSVIEKDNKEKSKKTDKDLNNHKGTEIETETERNSDRIIIARKIMKSMNKEIKRMKEATAIKRRKIKIVIDLDKRNTKNKNKIGTAIKIGNESETRKVMKKSKRRNIKKTDQNQDLERNSQREKEKEKKDNTKESTKDDIKYCL